MVVGLLLVYVLLGLVVHHLLVRVSSEVLLGLVRARGTAATSDGHCHGDHG
jgi:hypothetical protein